VTFTDEERAELTAALRRAVMVANGLLEACQHFTQALERETRPSEQQIAAVRQHLERWREDLDKLKQRLPDD
jgi:hypothetical protein